MRRRAAKPWGARAIGAGARPGARSSVKVPGIQPDDEIGLPERRRRIIDAKGGAHWAGRHAGVVVVPGAEGALHRRPRRARIELAQGPGLHGAPAQQVEQVKDESVLGWIDGVHADVAVRAALGACTTPDAIVLDDRDLPPGDADDPLDAAHTPNGILTMPARRRKKEVVQLQTAELEPAVTVAPSAGIGAVLAICAEVLVDDQHRPALDDSGVDQRLP